MLLIAVKRLWSRPLLTLLSIVGVGLAVGLVASIPIFAQATSFEIMLQEMRDISAQTNRPLFTARVYVLPSARFSLSCAHTRELADLIQDALSAKIGLPVRTLTRQLETTGIMIYPLGPQSPYGASGKPLLDASLAFLSGVEPYLTVTEGASMETLAPSAAGTLDVWMNATIADELGIQAGETYELRDLRHGISMPGRIAGTWLATDPRDPYWQQDPNVSLRQKLLVREADYEAIAEPLFGAKLGFASWYLVLDESRLAPERMRDYRDGLLASAEILSEFLPDVGLDSTPLDALDVSLQRQADLTALLFAFSVPLMGCLFYFMSLISSIAVRWQQRETAVMVGRGMRGRQCVQVGALESAIVVGIGLALGILCGTLLARAMGYTQSFLSFAWREALPVSALSLNVPMIALTVVIAVWARLAPIARAARTSVVEHERGRSRAHRAPFWQRFYLDVALLAVALYARDRLEARGSVVPPAVEDVGTALSGSSKWIATIVRQLRSPMFQAQDPLVFLVPSLFTLALALLLVRFFPLLMRVGDGLGALTRRTTIYLAFRQLARQSHQYTQALLLIIISLSLGAFMASMATSLDRWLIDRIYYAIGSDVLLKQMPPETDPLDPPPPPTEGAWLFPAEVYTTIPGIDDAARVAIYPAVMTHGDGSKQAGVYVGIDRLDLPEVLFFRADFGEASLGEMMNQLAQHRDGVIVSRRVFEKGNYEIGDTIRLKIDVVGEVEHEADYRIVGTYAYFPTVYEERQAVEAARAEALASRSRGRRASSGNCRTFSCLQEQAMGKAAAIGNLQYLYDQIGATYLHYLWFKIDPDSDPRVMRAQIENLKVYINQWVDARDSIAVEMARTERVGILGVLTIGFLGAATLSGIGLMVYNYASLQERIFRFTILRAVGLSLRQLVGQVGIEYLMLMAYSIAGGAGIGALASRLFIRFFQAADRDVLRPPALVPLVAWDHIARISGVFVVVLVVAQGIVISAALRSGVFQALRMGDRE